MGHAGIDSDSSDAALRCYAPPFLREPYLRACFGAGTANERLAWRLSFAETVARTLVAVLWPEGAASGKVRDDLLDRLERPSMGTWLTAASAMARTLAGVPDAVAGPAAAMLRRPGKGKPTAAFHALYALVAVRNSVAHGAGGYGVNEAQAERLLRETAGALREVAAALRWVRALRVATVARGASAGPRWILFGGADPEERSVAAGDHVPQDGAPALVDAAGRWVSAAPWICVGPFTEQGLRSPRLLDRVERGAALYLCPRGGTSTPPVAAQPVWPAQLEGLRAPLVARPARSASLAAAQRPTHPTTLGGGAIRVADRLGGGGSGAVYLAQRGDRREAVKVLHPSARPVQRQHRRLRREFEVLSRLTDPTVVRVYDHGFDADWGPYLEMEYVEGVDLEVAHAAAPLAPERAAALVDQVLAGLEAVHAAGLVHRDVKPANVMVDGAGRVRLVDFGIAFDDGAERLTHTLEAVGTRRFAAPEQLAGGRVTAAADLYAVGALLAWLTTGDAGGPGRVPAGLPSGLTALLRCALHPAPEHRFPSAAAMRAALAGAAAAGWRGAPAGKDEVVGGAWRLTETPRVVDPGVWCAPGVEVATESPVGLVLAQPGTPGGERLRGALARAARAELPAYRTAVEKGDGLLVGVMASRDLEATVRRLLAPAPLPTDGPVGGRAEPRAPAPPRRVRSEGAATDPRPAPDRTPAAAEADAPGPEARLRALAGVAKVTCERGRFIARDDRHRTRAIAARTETLDAAAWDRADALLLLAEAERLACPFVALTDGHRWQWRRRAGVRRFLPCGGPPAR